jgi:DNA-binding transcriptional LysR family regulator
LIPISYHLSMDIRRLRYFVAAAEEENFHRAAARLHIVQPALSKQIAALEEELGCALFIRSQRRIYLSPAGQLFLQDVRRILRDMQLATERVRQAAAGQVGTLRIGFRETAARSPIVSRAIGEFRAAYPNVELQLSQVTSPAQCKALRAGELDAGFIYLSAEHDAGLARIPVATDRFYLALHSAHRLAKRKRIYLRDLIDEPFIWLARSRNAYYSDALLRDCLRGGLTPKIIQEADSEATSLNLVAVGMGVSFIVAEAASPRPDVILKPVIELDNLLTLALAWDNNTHSPFVANFVEIVRRINR